MSGTSAQGSSASLNKVKLAFALTGVVAAIVGLLVLIWPGHTAEAVVMIIAIYALIAGIVYAAIGIFTTTSGAWARIGHIVLGLAFIVLGIVALANLAAATIFAAATLGILVGVVWVIEGVVALTTLKTARSRGWSIFFAVVSILAGALLLFSPLYVALLWLYLGASLLVLGIVQIVRAFTFTGFTISVGAPPRP